MVKIVEELLKTLASELISAANIADTNSPLNPVGSSRVTIYK